MALISDWMSRCLLCMNDVPAEIQVFGSHGQRKSVRRMIAEFLNVTVKESDNYPRQICERCYETLQRINDLKVSAHESLHNLKLLQNFHQQKEQEGRKTEYIKLWLGSQRREQGLDQLDSSNQQQQHSDFTCSSISANEATSSLVAFNISANSNNTRSVSSEAARQEKSERGVHHKGKKRPSTPLPFSTPSSRSCSPQPGALPPESSRKQYRSAARSQQRNRSKVAVQQNGVNGLPEKNVDHAGSPQPGSLPPETTGKGSAVRKRSKNLSDNAVTALLQSKSNSLVPVCSGYMTEPEENVEFQRSQSCSPIRGNNCNASPLTSSGNRKRRGRPRSKSLPPSKRSKADVGEPQPKSRNKTASKPSPWKPYVDDDICFERVITSCNLKQFKKHIPFVKLERLDVPESKCSVPQIPSSLVQTQQEFNLVEEIEDKKLGIVQQFCWICNKTFPSNKNMEQHLMKHREKLQVGCSSTKKVTEPSSKNATQSVFACNLCHIQFTTRGSLQRHMKFHSEKKWSYKCTKCEETFRTSIILEHHMKNHNISDAVFTTTQDLESHRKSHEQQQEFTRSCCLQEFASEEALRKHMLQHRKCTLCNKTFAGKNELAAHVGKCHKVCNICDETVADEEELESHIETSHEKCNLCGEQFLGDEELSAHLSKHPYQCVLCLSAFNDKAQRNEHLKLSHQDMLELLMETMGKEKSTA